MRVHFEFSTGESTKTFASTCLELPENASVLAFCKAAFDEYKDLLPVGLRASALDVFPDGKAEGALPVETRLAGYGLSDDARLIVPIPQVWVRLIHGATRVPVADLYAAPMRQQDSIGMLKAALCMAFPDTLGRERSRVRVYATRATFDREEALQDGDKVATHGSDKNDPLIVKAPGSESGLPGMIHLSDHGKFNQECGLTEWKRGSVHEIPLIWEFMKDLGGCTSNGIVFWRLEDRMLVSLLVNGWFQESQLGDFAALKEKRVIVLGSPGVGKSVITCVMAFYLALARKQKILLYRSTDEGEYLLYLEYEAPGDSVVYFTVEEEQCDPTKATKIYRALCEKHGKQKVWLLLDGFVLQDVPAALTKFKMLSTSLQVSSKQFEGENSYFGLLSSWRERDLVALGRLVYGFDEDEFARRYFFSGGNVRYFGFPSVGDIKDEIDGMLCSSFTNLDELYSSRYLGWSDSGRMNRLRRTFLNLNLGTEREEEDKEEALEEKNGDGVTVQSEESQGFVCLRSRAEWEQAVDLLYAVQTLTENISEDKLVRFYNWALAADHPSLAAGLYEAFMYRMARENQLQLVVTELQQHSQETDRSFTQLGILEGSANRGDSEVSQPEVMLNCWRVDTKSTYWSAGYRHAKTVDAIVKVTSTTSSKIETVAYLDVVTGPSHSVDAEKLRELNRIFRRSSTCGLPMYLVLCPDETACDKVVLGPIDRVVAAQQICQVCVGYCPALRVANIAPSREKRSPSSFEPRWKPIKHRKTCT